MNIQKKVEEILLENDIIKPPIDLDKILESYGIRKIEKPITDDISGVLDTRDSENITILVNADHGINRKNFSTAHEIGHFVLHNKEGLHVDKLRFYRDGKSSEGIIKEEIDANKFAAELLMPKHMIVKAISDSKIIDLQDDIFLSNIAKKFRVSKMAMAVRLKNLFPSEFEIAF